MPKLNEAEKRLVKHVALPSLRGRVIMGTDAVESTGHALNLGTNVSIKLELDSRALGPTGCSRPSARAAGRPCRSRTGSGVLYWGSLTDKYGVQWRFNYMEPRQ